MTETSPDTRLDSKQAITAIRSGALLIDVRSEAGRFRDGEVRGAVIVPKTDVVDFVTRLIDRKSPDQKIVIFCSSIKGSQPVIENLVAAGVRNVFDVDGAFPALTGEDGLKKIERAQPAA